jgi:CubicO group peptidase (beta-lactamase class C family)
VLELNDLTVDDPIGPWLPPEWDVGNGVAEQTFRDFLTHETGFTQKGVDPDGDNTLAFIENAVGIDVPFFTNPAYNNANFGIFRVLVPRLAGFDFDAFPEYTDEELYGGFFVYAALEFFDRVDVLITCNPSQPNPVIYYGYPHNGFNGFQAATDFSLECGGYGFFASAEELAPILADLTAGDELISDDSVMAMKEGQLGFFDPANGYFWGNGGLGLYHNHGGDWDAGSKGLDTCVMLFPNGITATLLINSIGGDYGGADLYQCDLLRQAFDDAWEPN